jgi:hypothetical protein
LCTSAVSHHITPHPTPPHHTTPPHRIAPVMAMVSTQHHTTPPHRITSHRTCHGHGQHTTPRHTTTPHRTNTHRIAPVMAMVSTPMRECSRLYSDRMRASTGSADLRRAGRGRVEVGMRRRRGVSGTWVAWTPEARRHRQPVPAGGARQPMPDRSTIRTQVACCDQQVACLPRTGVVHDRRSARCPQAHTAATSHANCDAQEQEQVHVAARRVGGRVERHCARDGGGM